MKENYNIIYYNIFVSTISLLFVSISELNGSYLLMLLYSLNSLFTFGYLLFNEIIHFKGLNIKPLLLVGCFLRFVLPSITKSWGALNGESYFFLRPDNDYTDYMFPTVIWMNIYYSIFYWCFLKFDANYTIEKAIKPFFLKIRVSRVIIPVFTIGIIFNIYSSYIPAGIIPNYVSTFLGNLATLAIMAQLFESIFKPSRFNKSLFVFFILVSLWQTIVFGFYKGAIMTNFLLLLLYYFLNRKYYKRTILTPNFIVGILSLFIIVDLVIYPFMSAKRVIAGWDPTSGGIATEQYSNIDILMSVLSTNAQKEKSNHTAADRLDAIGANAYFYKECCTKGLRTQKILESNIELLVPRFIKPNKHDSEAGRMVYAYATTGRFENYDSALSNNYIGQFASAYLIGGGIMAILLAFFNGWFLMYYYNFLMRRITYILAVLLLLPLVLSAILAFEEIHDGGALRAGYNIVMMIALSISIKFFPNFLKISNTSANGNVS